MCDPKATLCFSPNKQIDTTFINKMKRIEREYAPSATYMKHHTITISMRAILVNWLVQVAQKFKLYENTLYITIHYIDRFLSLQCVNSSQLQLVGIAAMFIACKFEEVIEPNSKKFVQITAYTYTVEELVQMKALILYTLQFNLLSYTSFSFLSRFCSLFKMTKHACTRAKFLTQMTLREYAFLQFLPSQIAASAIVLTLSVDKKTCWSDEIVQCIAYEPLDLAPCIREMTKRFGHLL